MFDRQATHEKNEYLSRQKKEQKRAQAIIEAAKKDIAYRNESEVSTGQIWIHAISSE